MQASPCARDNRDSDKFRLHFNYVINVFVHRQPRLSSAVDGLMPHPHPGRGAWESTSLDYSEAGLCKHKGPFCLSVDISSSD